MPGRGYWSPYDNSNPNIRGGWTLDSLSSLAAGWTTDLTNNGATGVALTTGYIPYGDFDGVDEFLSLADNARWDITGALSLSCWFYLDNLGTQRTLIAKYGASGQRSYILRATSSNTVEFEISGNGTNAFTIASVGTVAAATWTHAGAMYNPSTEITVWLNGTEASNVTSIPASIFNSTALLTLGATGDSASRFFLDGRISQAVIWNVSLADAGFTDIFDDGRITFSV